MLHFLLEGLRSDSYIDISHAAFELGCRLNTKFAIHRNRDSVPSDGIVVSYGCEGASVVVPRSRSRSELVRYDGDWLYAGSGELPDVFQGTADLLAFRHEADASVRDGFGRVPPNSNPLAPALREPLVENNATFLRRLIERSGATIPRCSTPFGEGRYAVCMTHDVDGPQLHSAFALLRALLLAVRGDKYERESLEIGILTKAFGREDPYWNFQLWQAFEKAFGARSTFLVYPGKLPAAPRHPRDPHYDPDTLRYRSALKKLVDDGWEVGPHIGIRGHSTAAYKQAIDHIGRLSGGLATSVRTHYWSGVSPDPWVAWRQMDEAGFETDASLSPQVVGYRGGTMMPIMPSYRWRTTGSGFVALPTALMDAYIVPRTAGSARQELEEQVSRILTNARKENALVVLDWHCRTLCNTGAWKGFASPLVEILQHIASDGSAKFMTMTEVGQAWRDHAERCFLGASDRGPMP